MALLFLSNIYDHEGIHKQLCVAYGGDAKISFSLQGGLTECTIMRSEGYDTASATVETQDQYIKAITTTIVFIGFYKILTEETK